MRKITIAIAIIIGTLVVAKMSGMLVNYKLPTSSNEPTIHINSHLFGSSLIKPKVGDFATFLPPLPEVTDSDKHIYIKRLCGLGGDEIEMKNGVFYLNGTNFDSSLTLQHCYYVNEKDFRNIKMAQPISEFNKLPNGIYQIYITDAVATAFGVTDKKEIHKTVQQGQPLAKEFTSNPTWTRDNFGPITVPDNMAFFMGDNRHYSYDCRYFGFVSTEKISGTIIGY